MKKIVSILSLSFFIFSISSTSFTYARTLSKKEYRYLRGAYLLGRGNKKRLIKLLNKTDVINTKISELENKQKALEKNIENLKSQIKDISDKLDKIMNLLKTISSSNAKPEIKIKSSSYSQPKTNKKSLNIEKKDTLKSISKEDKEKSSKIQKEKKTQENIVPTKPVFEKDKNENIKKAKERRYTISDLINDIENAIYYKGKGDKNSYEKLIKEMIKKYPDYRSKLENCLKDPDYIFQLYIEVLNLETK